MRPSGDAAMRWMKTLWPILGRQKHDAGLIAAHVLESVTDGTQYSANTFLAAHKESTVADDVKRRQIALAVRYVAVTRLR
jgi:hypothetical protein